MGTLATKAAPYELARWGNTPGDLIEGQVESLTWDASGVKPTLKCEIDTIDYVIDGVKQPPGIVPVWAGFLLLAAWQEHKLRKGDMVAMVYTGKQGRMKTYNVAVERTAASGPYVDLVTANAEPAVAAMTARVPKSKGDGSGFDAEDPADELVRLRAALAAARGETATFVDDQIT